MVKLKDLLDEKTTGFTDSGRGYQNKETQIQSVNAVKDASKKVGKLQQNVVGKFIKDIKQINIENEQDHTLIDEFGNWFNPYKPNPNQLELFDDKKLD